MFKFSKIITSHRLIKTSMLGKEFQLKTDILYFVNLDNEITGAKVRIPATLSASKACKIAYNVIIRTKANELPHFERH